MADPAPDPAPVDAPPPEGKDDTSFTSSHTSNFPALLRQLGISLVVSTYQAGKLIFVRAQEEALNTHFRNFFSPMGVAYQHEKMRLAIGTKSGVQEFRSQREVAPKVEPPGP